MDAVKNISRQSVGAFDGDGLCSRREDTSLRPETTRRSSLHIGHLSTVMFFLVEYNKSKPKRYSIPNETRDIY
jgi:hypothetical protein